MLLRSRPTATHRTKGPQSRSERVIQAVCAVLFSLGWLFLAAGLEHAFLAMRSRSWVTVPAVVNQVDVRYAHRGTREVIASFRYTYAGHEHIGTRVGLARGGYNFSSWERQVRGRLTVAHESGRPIDCYVNPNRPDQAVLDRTLRLGVLLFQLGLGLPFAAIGTLLWISLVLAAFSKRRTPTAADHEAMEESSA
jgi:hypothetical protein